MTSLEEYLHTSYEPDAEFVEGELVERSIGEWQHSLTQSNLIYVLGVKYRGVLALPSVRMRTTNTRYRIPDIAVIWRPPKTKFLEEAPVLVVEILSEDDRVTRTLERLGEYEALGIPNIWVVDPRLRQMFEYRGGSLLEISGEAIRTSGTPEIELTRAEIFANCEPAE